MEYPGSVSRELDEQLRSREVIRHGHFSFARNERPFQLHGRIFVNPRAIFWDYEIRLRAVQALMDNIPNPMRDLIEVVAGPATGGAILASDLSWLISASRPPGQPKVGAVFFTKAGKDEAGADDYILHPSDYHLVASRNVLLVDDVRHRGHTFALCANRIRQAEGNILATAQIIDRGYKNPLPIASGGPGLGTARPNFTVLTLDPDPLYERKDCPMCQLGERITLF
jgi:orotate phosphoribosyltransferase